MKPPLPTSNGFWLLTSAYLDAGDAVFLRLHAKDYVGFMERACFFLYFRSIELALKALLVFHGVPQRGIERKLGHRVSCLLVRVESFVPMSKLGIAADDRKLLDLFSDQYSEKWFEYSEDFWRNRNRDRPELPRLRDLAKRVHDKMRPYEREAMNIIRPSATATVGSRGSSRTIR